MKKWWVIPAIGIAATIIACGTGSPSDNDVSRVNEHANTSVSPTKPANQQLQIDGGDWEVGKKDNISAGIISPGKYVIIATESGYGCYWETVKNFDKNGDYIIANGNVDPGHTGIAVVKSTYAGLSLVGDCLAKKKG